MVWSHSPMVSVPSGGRRLTPAELTRMSGSPNAAAAASAPRSSEARSPRSALTHAASAPAARSPRAVSSSASSPRATSTTRAPGPARARAMPWPMPELPPVTTATLPSSENSSRR